MKITNKKELYNFIKNNIKKDTKLSSTYYLIKYNNGQLEPIYFTKFQDVYFESPCCLHEYDLKEEDLVDYVKEMYEEQFFEDALEFEKTMQIGNKHYDIDVPQTNLFLPDEFEIIEVFSDRDCVEWMLKNKE